MELSEVVELIAEDLQQVEAAVQENFRSDVAMVPIIGDYIFSGGGKRFRPILVLLSSRLCGYHGSRSITHACVVEFLHTATLLHDDVVDGAEKRRGHPSANAKYGNELSVLVGDFLLARSVLMTTQDGSLKLLELLSDTVAIMSEGEILQLANVRNVNLSEDEYLKVIHRKTAALIATSCRIGSVLGEAGEEKEQALWRFGEKVGMAFQLTDDVLDLTADEERLGKAVGTDLREGSVTLPLILLLQQANSVERQEITEILGTGQIGPPEIERVVNLMRRYRALERTADKARRFIRDAHADLEYFEPSPYLEGLKAVADYVVTRGQ